MDGLGNLKALSRDPFQASLSILKLTRVASHAPPPHPVISSCCSCFGSAVSR